MSCLLVLAPVGLLAARHCGLACLVRAEYHLKLGLVLSNDRVQRMFYAVNQNRPDCLHVVVKDEPLQTLCNGILQAGWLHCQSSKTASSRHRPQRRAPRFGNSLRQSASRERSLTVVLANVLSSTGVSRRHAPSTSRLLLKLDLMQAFSM